MCGLAHVLSSVLIGFITIALGLTFSKILHLELVRGQIASWLLLSFGVICIVHSLCKFTKNKTHKHFEISENNDIYVFEHQH
jgi:sulfite exporter TauE/SafE